MKDERKDGIKMISTSIIYSNLRAEMARRNINIQTIADTLGIRRETASRKLSGKQSIGLNKAAELKLQLQSGLRITNSLVDALFARS